MALKPGKPVYFGTKGPKLCFGLPGNPVSALLTFLEFVSPALDALQAAAPPEARANPAVLAHEVTKVPGRMELVRVRLVETRRNSFEYGEAP